MTIKLALQCRAPSAAIDKKRLTWQPGVALALVVGVAAAEAPPAQAQPHPSQESSWVSHPINLLLCGWVGEWVGDSAGVCTLLFSFFKTASTWLTWPIQCVCINMCMSMCSDAYSCPHLQCRWLHPKYLSIGRSQRGQRR